MTTLNPGIHARIPIADYIRDPAPAPSISTRTAQALLEECPARAWYNHPRLNPDWKEDEGNGATDVGKIAHDLLLEGVDRVALVEADDWRTKAAKEQRELGRLKGKIPLLAHKWPPIKAMVEAAKAAIAAAKKEIGYPLEGLLVEQTLIWQDEGDAWCRSRPDLLTPDFRFAIDYKTTNVLAEPEAFKRQIISMGYDLQAALIRAGVYAHTQTTPDVVFLVQECEPPYLCSWVALAPAFAEIADAKLHAAIARWNACRAAKSWPGYPPQFAYVEPPAWEIARAEAMGLVAHGQR